MNFILFFDYLSIIPVVLLKKLTNIKQHHRENTILTINNRNCSFIIIDYLVNIDGMLVIHCKSIPNDIAN